MSKGWKRLNIAAWSIGGLLAIRLLRKQYFAANLHAPDWEWYAFWVAAMVLGFLVSLWVIKGFEKRD